jgi:hypothetical protein
MGAMARSEQSKSSSALRMAKNNFLPRQIQQGFNPG